jgi:Cys-tRNA(Pro)/Cys-tRNA(Cys) deacylase
MEKEYKTILDSSCRDFDTFVVSASKIGHQIELSPKDLIGLINCRIDNVIKAEI